MKAWLFVGAKVVCVSYKIPAGAKLCSGVLLPLIGDTYTISHTKSLEQPNGEDWSVWVRLADFYPGLAESGDEFWMPSCWFAPLTNVTHQVEALRRLMQDARQSGKVEA
jgi:hypothetical protein